MCSFKPTSYAAWVVLVFLVGVLDSGLVFAQVSNAHPSVSPDGSAILFDSDRTPQTY